MIPEAVIREKKKPESAAGSAPGNTGRPAAGLAKTFLGSAEGLICQAPAGNQDNVAVGRELILVEAKDLAKAPFRPVSPDRVAHPL